MAKVAALCIEPVAVLLPQSFVTFKIHYTLYLTR